MANNIDEAREALVKRHWWGYGMAILISYALAGPLLRFTPPDVLQLFGLFVAGVVFAGYWGLIYFGDRDAKYMIALALLLAVAASVIATPMLNNATADSEANDRRCLAIQRDMVSAHRRIPDGPALFQAFGCRPQGSDPRLFVPPTDREKRAGHALPYGGYPRPQ
ncbi:hypothetical protein SAMN05192583_0560 [Sphingomonas gellani]|uniref:Uncharacterized protein n=1 Tax=Sphingomonas gellani TaxID=1166340 RepID=A0A1H7Z978_9SPHN|nr:hypothetical protein [Sphingomonas gellani]SEM54057.1 hypothetical protein SAMN05192583_0560 [Sphingomonas gellani]